MVDRHNPMTRYELHAYAAAAAACENDACKLLMHCGRLPRCTCCRTDAALHAQTSLHEFRFTTTTQKSSLSNRSRGREQLYSLHQHILYLAQCPLEINDSAVQCSAISIQTYSHDKLVEGNGMHSSSNARTRFLSKATIWAAGPYDAGGPKTRRLWSTEPTNSLVAGLFQVQDSTEC